ncbi:uncharacterized protein B0H64DRAFT_387933 [Chaetomium fimeti]|uniref:Uncharacterized protein n=1 Tax=Chaetomium fimeti TaxID=1854472 RepID=A0AAE0HP60_9PEZI|nr:hypothetical protein B0H64DRAFT_387933 [Chaetomium fimeti]
MCRETFWQLPCGHPRTIHMFCEEFSFKPGPLDQPLPCIRLTRTEGHLASIYAFCTHPGCQYQGLGWWCCSCKQRNVGSQWAGVCSNTPTHIIANRRPDMRIEPGCGHCRCVQCQSDPTHLLIIGTAEELITGHNNDDYQGVDEDKDVNSGQKDSKDDGNEGAGRRQGGN